MSAAGSSSVGVAPEQPRQTLDASRAGHPLRTAGFLAVESVCPLILTAILVDCTRRVEWVSYERDPSIYASIARFWQDGLIPYRDVWEFKPPLIFVALRT